MRSYESGVRFLVTLWMSVLLAVSFATQHAVADPKQKRLTQHEVKQFIASYPDVKKIVVSYAKEKKTGVSEAKSGLAMVIAVASDKSVRGRVDTAVKAHGFDNSKEWVEVAESVGHAYAHIKSGGAEAKAERKVEKAIRKIKKMDFLTDEQKKKLVSEVREKAGDLLAPPPPENVAAVEPMVAQLESVVK